MIYRAEFLISKRSFIRIRCKVAQKWHPKLGSCYEELYPREHVPGA